MERCQVVPCWEGVLKQAGGWGPRRAAVDDFNRKVPARNCHAARRCTVCCLALSTCLSKAPCPLGVQWLRGMHTPLITGFFTVVGPLQQRHRKCVTSLSCMQVAIKMVVGGFIVVCGGGLIAPAAVYQECRQFHSIGLRVYTACRC
jgi:hypothetical protein